MCPSSSVFLLVLPGDGPHPGSELRDGRAVGRGGERLDAFQGGAHAGFIRINPTHARFSHLGWSGQLLESLSSNKGNIDAVKKVEKGFQYGLQPGDDLSELGQQSVAAQLRGVMHGGLKVEHALAFGITLQGQLAKIQLEDG